MPNACSFGLCRNNGAKKNLSDIKKKWIGPIDAAVRSEIKCKNKLWKRYLKSKDKAILEEHKHTSNRVRKQTREINKEE